jgi:energy-coupling factor transport system ATP-binding protein
MPIIEFKDYCYKYNIDNTLENISINIEEGEFVIITGPTGSGKTTLLRSIKKEILQQGNKKGKILYKGMDIQDLSDFDSASEIGMVFQNPDSQIVMGTVIEELCFSLENIGLSTEEIRKRVAEISMYFGLQGLLHKDIKELSEGQKQLINLASVLALRPKVLLLDEPISHLDYGNSFNFINILKRLNEELKLTIIMSTHRLNNLINIADKMVFLESGRIKYIGSPRDVIKDIFQNREEITKQYSILDVKSKKVSEGENILVTKSTYFSYDGKKPILKNISLNIKEGEILTVLGENGAGKTTLLQLLAGLIKPTEGKISKGKGKNVFYVSQNINANFVFDTVKEELLSICSDFEKLAKDFGLEKILNSHPMDISYGEQQKVLLAMALLRKANIIFLDEPTKGLDEICRIQLGKALKKLKDSGVAIIIATHDFEFTESYSDRNMLLFDGELINL